MVESLNRWEKTISLYRTASGVDISDGILAATVLEHSPESYQNILKQAPSNRRASYSAVRGWLREYAETLRKYDATSGFSSHQAQSTGPVPMEVDQTRAVSGFSSGNGFDGKGKAKGKGKSKDGKGKGKGKKGEKSKDQKPMVKAEQFRKDTAGTAKSGDTSVPTAESASPTGSRRVVRQQLLWTMTARSHSRDGG